MNAVVEHDPNQSAYDRLSRREKRFVDAYVPGATGAEAARTAGHKGLYPEVAAYRLLQRQDIQAAIEEREAHYIREMGVRAERIMRETMAVAFADPRKLVDPETGKALPLHKLSPEMAAAISAVDVEDISTEGLSGTRYKYKLWDKNKAIEKLGQFRKLWDAKGPTVNVDARSVTNNTVNVGGSEAVRAVADLSRVIATIGSSHSLPASDQNGPLLPVAVRDEPQGRGASVDAGEDSGSTGTP
jgi:phage terminase small subunit